MPLKKIFRKRSQAKINLDRDESESAHLAVRFCRAGIFGLRFSRLLDILRRRKNEQFQALSYKDLRNPRTNASTLRGWMLDRTGKLGSALAYYKVEKDGRYRPHVSRLKRKWRICSAQSAARPDSNARFIRREADPMPEAWEILTKYKKPEAEKQDVRITIDRDLQAYAAQQIGRKKRRNRRDESADRRCSGDVFKSVV